VGTVAAWPEDVGRANQRVPMRAWSHGSPEVGFWLHTGEVDLVQGNDSNLTVKR